MMRACGGTDGRDPVPAANLSRKVVVSYDFLRPAGGYIRTKVQSSPSQGRNTHGRPAHYDWAHGRPAH